MSTSPTELTPLVLRSLTMLGRALDEAAEGSIGYLTTAQRREALLQTRNAATRLAALELRLIAASTDVAEADGCRDVATWLAHETRSDRGVNARVERLADALDRGWPLVNDALAEALLNLDQAHVIVRGLQSLPADVPAGILDRAEAHLVEEAKVFGPRELRVLARRVLDIVAPELGEDHERRALEREEHHARTKTRLTTYRWGDGTTEIRARVPGPTATRLLSYLEAFTAPRHHSNDDENAHEIPKDERLPFDQKLGRAFCSLLERLDPTRFPLHGGNATTSMVTIDLASLCERLGVAGLGAEDVITAGEARRLACTANIIPVVLGGKSEILDQGRQRRLFTPAQRKALALRDKTCRAQGCEIPVAWCEAHHRNPWTTGGKTDLADGVLLCHFHHQRTHDSTYHHTRTPGGEIRYHDADRPAGSVL